MALKQERMLALITIACEQQEELETIREFSSRMLSYMHELSVPGELRDQISNLSAQLDKFTTPKSNRMRIIETEKAYYNPTRIKHNEYMRTMQRKYNTKRKLAIDPLDLGAEEFESEIGIDMVPRQNNEHPCQNNVAIEEVPLLARIEAQAAEYEKSNQPTQNSPSESEKALKAKFGPDFHPLPARVGLKRNQT